MPKDWRVEHLPSASEQAAAGTSRPPAQEGGKEAEGIPPSLAGSRQPLREPGQRFRLSSDHPLPLHGICAGHALVWPFTPSST